MARTPRVKKDEHVEVLRDGPIPEVEAPYSMESEVKADARDKNKPPPPTKKPPEVKVPRVFRVKEDKRALVNGYRTILRAGKEIDTLNYDIRRLQSQGVKLEEIKPEDRAGAFGSSLDGYR